MSWAGWVRTGGSNFLSALIFVESAFHLRQQVAVGQCMLKSGIDRGQLFSRLLDQRMDVLALLKHLGEQTTRHGLKFGVRIVWSLNVQPPRLPTPQRPLAWHVVPCLNVHRRPMGEIRARTRAGQSEATQSRGLSFPRWRLLECPQSTLQTKVNGIMTIRTAMRRPSGFVPLAMSGAALYVVLRHLVLFGAASNVPVDPRVGRPDEGPEAHIWQIMMTGQVPIILYFAIRWLGSDPVGTLSVPD